MIDADTYKTAILIDLVAERFGCAPQEIVNLLTNYVLSEEFSKEIKKALAKFKLH